MYMHDQATTGETAPFRNLQFMEKGRRKRETRTISPIQLSHWKQCSSTELHRAPLGIASQLSMGPWFSGCNSDDSVANQRKSATALKHVSGQHYC